jgi:hypothetical protein
MLHVKFLA